MIKIIVGLGNPGKKYVNTRHNAGFIFVDKIAQENKLSWNYEKKFKADLSKFDKLVLVKPQEYMNRSGYPVATLLNYFNVQTDELLVVHDDVDLEKSTYKLMKNRGPAGHKGVTDVIDKLGTKDFWRLRIGVGRPPHESFDVDEYVLGELDGEEVEYINNIALSNFNKNL